MIYVTALTKKYKFRIYDYNKNVASFTHRRSKPLTFFLQWNSKETLMRNQCCFMSLQWTSVRSICIFVVVFSSH